MDFFFNSNLLLQLDILCALFLINFFYVSSVPKSALMLMSVGCVFTVTSLCVVTLDHNIYSTSFEMLSAVPHGSVLCPIFFHVFINELYSPTKHYRYLSSADIKSFRTVYSVTDSTLLQFETDPIRGWSAAV